MFYVAYPRVVIQNNHQRIKMMVALILRVLSSDNPVKETLTGNLGIYCRNISTSSS